MNLTFLGEYVPDQPRDTSGMHVFGLKKYYRQTTVLEIKATVRLSMQGFKRVYFTPLTRSANEMRS